MVLKRNARFAAWLASTYEFPPIFLRGEAVNFSRYSLDRRDPRGFFPGYPQSLRLEHIAAPYPTAMRRSRATSSIYSSAEYNVSSARYTFAGAPPRSISTALSGTYTNVRPRRPCLDLRAPGAIVISPTDGTRSPPAYEFASFCNNSFARNASCGCVAAGTNAVTN